MIAGGEAFAVWVRRTSIERYVEGLPLIVVMPDGGRSFYTDAIATPKAAYETVLVRDLIGFMDRTFQTLPERSGRVIGGLFMGGYGALKLALKHPDLFCAAVSHSGATALRNPRPNERNHNARYGHTDGASHKHAHADGYGHADKRAAPTLPRTRLDRR
jgi:S-formylglutathione hydrolase FrmB